MKRKLQLELVCARMDLNQRPSHYQCDALTTWATCTEMYRWIPSSVPHSPAYVLDAATLLAYGLTANFVKWIVSSLPCTSVLGGEGETRTHAPLLAKQMLYPSELQPHWRSMPPSLLSPHVPHSCGLIRIEENVNICALFLLDDVPRF